MFGWNETTVADYAVYGTVAVSVAIAALRILAIVLSYSAPIDAFSYIASQVATEKAPPTVLQQAE